MGSQSSGMKHSTYSPHTLNKNMEAFDVFSDDEIVPLV